MSDQLRQAAEAVVRAFDMTPEERDDCVAFSLTECIDALRAALAEGAGDDPYPRYYISDNCDAYMAVSPELTLWRIDIGGRWQDTGFSEHDLLRMDRPGRGQLHRTDADGNRLEGTR